MTNICLLYPSIEGQGLSTLLTNEGFKVDSITRREFLSTSWLIKGNPLLFLVNLDFICNYEPTEILKKLHHHQTAILFGDFNQLHWLTKLPTNKKGFLSRKATFTDLLSLCKDGAVKNNLLDPFVTEFLQNSYLEKQNILLKVDLEKPFSKRELVIMREISNENTTNQIATNLHLSKHTIYNHRKNILHKIDRNSAFELTKFCIFHKEAVQTLISINQRVI